MFRFLAPGLEKASNTEMVVAREQAPVAVIVICHAKSAAVVLCMATASEAPFSEAQAPGSF
jgi:hypothetical protein